MSFSQPIKGAIAANIRRIMKLRMESTVASCRKSHLVDVSFEDGGGKTAENIKDEQDGKAGVRKVESRDTYPPTIKTRIRIPILRGPK